MRLTFIYTPQKPIIRVTIDARSLKTIHEAAENAICATTYKYMCIKRRLLSFK